MFGYEKTLFFYAHIFFPNNVYMGLVKGTKPEKFVKRNLATNVRPVAFIEIRPRDYNKQFMLGSAEHIFFSC